MGSQQSQSNPQNIGYTNKLKLYACQDISTKGNRLNIDKYINCIRNINWETDSTDGTNGKSTSNQYVKNENPHSAHTDTSDTN